MVEVYGYLNLENGNQVDPLKVFSVIDKFDLSKFNATKQISKINRNGSKKIYANVEDYLKDYYDQKKYIILSNQSFRDYAVNRNEFEFSLYELFFRQIAFTKATTPQLLNNSKLLLIKSISLIERSIIEDISLKLADEKFEELLLSQTTLDFIKATCQNNINENYFELFRKYDNFRDRVRLEN